MKVLKEDSQEKFPKNPPPHQLYNCSTGAEGLLGRSRRDLSTRQPPGGLQVDAAGLYSHRAFDQEGTQTHKLPTLKSIKEMLPAAQRQAFLLAWVP